MTGRWPLIAALALVAGLSALRLIPGGEPASATVRVLSVLFLILSLAAIAGLLSGGRK